MRVIIVGSGAAGLFAAIELLDNPDIEIFIISKKSLRESNTYHAQGGIAAVLGKENRHPEDSIEQHILDTMECGSNWNNMTNVTIMCRSAVEIINQLKSININFDNTQDKARLCTEGGHSYPRILSISGDKTGMYLIDGLLQELRNKDTKNRVSYQENCVVTKIIQNRAGHVSGVEYYSSSENHQKSLSADIAILATGGAGHLFSRTTNPTTATGDGIYLAHTIGAKVEDLEFFQFHPTVTIGTNPFMISEAVRGEGAFIVNSKKERFMKKYHKKAELAPRDIVSRAIIAEMQTTTPGQQIFLDTNPITKKHGKDYLKKRFPKISAELTYRGYDWTTQLIPISPAAHYWMGGITTNLEGETTIKNLYAIGETACNKTQGANRLASNSLLEALVFAKRTAKHIKQTTKNKPQSTVIYTNKQIPTPISFAPKPISIPAQTFTCSPEATLHIKSTLKSIQSQTNTIGKNIAKKTDPNTTTFHREQLQQLMFTNSGISRNYQDLQTLLNQLKTWNKTLHNINPKNLHDIENKHLAYTASLLVQAAINNTKSLGSHHRNDI